MGSVTKTLWRDRRSRKNDPEPVFTKYPDSSLNQEVLFLRIVISSLVNINFLNNRIQKNSENCGNDHDDDRADFAEMYHYKR